MAKEKNKGAEAPSKGRRNAQTSSRDANSRSSGGTTTIMPDKRTATRMSSVASATTGVTTA